MRHDVRKIYGQYQVSTLSPEEAVVKLHEKILERIDKVIKLNKEIKAFPAKRLLENKGVEEFNELLDEKNKHVDLIIDSIDAIKGLISDDTPKELKNQIFRTYDFIKLKFLKAILEEKSKDFKDVKAAIETLLDGWRKVLNDSTSSPRKF